MFCYRKRIFVVYGHYFDASQPFDRYIYSRMDGVERHQTNKVLLKECEGSLRAVL